MGVTGATAMASADSLFRALKLCVCTAVVCILLDAMVANLSPQYYYLSSSVPGLDGRFSAPPFVRYSLGSGKPSANSSKSPGATEVAEEEEDSGETQLEHILFGIASSAQKWQNRSSYARLWWEPQRSRGHVWLDRAPLKNETPVHAESLPEWRVSEDTSRFKFTHPEGVRSAIRVARIVKDAIVSLQQQPQPVSESVRWLVISDDDTVFFTENLVRVLRKYDHRQHFYVGGTSESVLQSASHAYNMAFGGAGIALSRPLAEALADSMDGCLDRYPQLYGSDHRIQCCASELGVPLTREAGFHQVDLRGQLVGLLMAHPVAPAVSLHHLDAVESLFAPLSREQALARVISAAHVDSSRLFQLSMCYYKQPNFTWTLALSWGYVAELYEGIVLPRELEKPMQTFSPWKWAEGATEGMNRFPFSFNHRPAPDHDKACVPGKAPKMFLLEGLEPATASSRYILNDFCGFRQVTSIVVRISPPRSIDWSLAPRRQCCDVIDFDRKNAEMQIRLRDCQLRESVMSVLHPSDFNSSSDSNSSSLS